MVLLIELKGFAMYAEELSMHSLFDIPYLLWDLTAAPELLWRWMFYSVTSSLLLIKMPSQLRM